MTEINEKELAEIANQYREKFKQYKPKSMSSFKDTDNLLHHLEYAKYFSSFDEEYKKEYIQVFNITTKTLDTYFELLEKNPQFRELELEGNQLEGIVGFPEILSYCNSIEGQKEQKEIFGTNNMVKEHYIMLCDKKLNDKKINE